VGNLPNYPEAASAIEARDPRKARRVIEKVLGYAMCISRANNRKGRKRPNPRTNKTLRPGKGSTRKTDKEE
jgi:hypothetical protein